MNKKRTSTAAPLDKSGEPARTYFLEGGKAGNPRRSYLFYKKLYMREAAQK